ncbi:unnamed protein product [Rangifer tarandus platyrhynchus]|uniref:Uncharacterized protein n=2 Tax=Rangifer tarandus platyrhynchus TaxID=3082113 RepID=A0AC59ZVR0_RANTA|nr:unnamed protein product [Rangifer tarandus platyrhynchus]
MQPRRVPGRRQQELLRTGVTKEPGFLTRGTSCGATRTLAHGTQSHTAAWTPQPSAAPGCSQMPPVLAPRHLPAPLLIPSVPSLLSHVTGTEGMVTAQTAALTQAHRAGPPPLAAMASSRPLAVNTYTTG